MRVFSIAQPVRQAPGEDQGLGKGRLFIASEPFGYRSIVGRSQGESLPRKPAPRLCANRSVARRQFRENTVVIGGVGDNCDGAVVLGGGSDQRYAADIDVLDAILGAR